MNEAGGGNPDGPHGNDPDSFMSKEQSAPLPALAGNVIQGRFQSPWQESIEGHELARICRSTPAAEHDARLLEALSRRYPGLEFRLTRGAEQWYRIGGVVDAQGDRLARDISEWVDRAFLECGQNFRTLVRYCRENGLAATRHQGVTLYIAASLGSQAEDFLQVEVDRTQEVRDRLLVDTGNPPADLEELIDPMEPSSLDQTPLGSPSYHYRRKTEVAIFMKELGRHYATLHPVRRFLDDWNRSSAGRHRVFCHRWNLKLHQHRGRFGEEKLDVAVLPANSTALPRMEAHAGKRGTTLQAALSHFDRQAGFPFAWFFFMAARRYVPPLLGEAVHRDLTGDFAYLPYRDFATLTEWVADPYFV